MVTRLIPLRAPRFFSSSTRSKRLRTLRLAPEEEALDLKLLCWVMTVKGRKGGEKGREGGGQGEKAEKYG